MLRTKRFIPSNRAYHARKTSERTHTPECSTSSRGRVSASHKDVASKETNDGAKSSLKPLPCLQPAACLIASLLMKGDLVLAGLMMAGSWVPPSHW